LSFNGLKYLGNRNWRESTDRDSDSRGGRSRRGSDSLHHDRGDHTRKKNFERSYGSDDEEAGSCLQGNARYVTSFNITFFLCFVLFNMG